MRPSFFVLVAMPVAIVAGVFALAARAAAPSVVATIVPIHSLVAGVMGEVGEPSLLVRPGASPHAYQLRPSAAGRLARADVVFWIGEGMETFLARPLDSLAGRAHVVKLEEAPDLEWLASRDAGVFTPRAAAGHLGHGHVGHEHGDPHLWLDPRNAARMTRAIAAALIEIDPDNAAAYVAGRDEVITRLEALERSMATRLAPLHDRPYIVLHDAYGYLEHRFGLAPVGAVAVSPQRPPGARRLRALRQHIVARKVACVFREPQFESALAHTLVEGTAARLAVLDPIGGMERIGPDAYFEMMEANATALETCLGAGAPAR